MSRPPTKSGKATAASPSAGGNRVSPGPAAGASGKLASTPMAAASTPATPSSAGKSGGRAGMFGSASAKQKQAAQERGTGSRRPSTGTELQQLIELHDEKEPENEWQITTTLDHTQIADYSDVKVPAWQKPPSGELVVAAKSMFAVDALESKKDVELRELIETMKEFLQKQRLHLHFEITSRRLQLMMNLGNIRALEDMGGVEGIAALLLVECDVGLSKEERLDAYIDRIEDFGVNNFPNLVSGSITTVFLSYWSDTSFLLVLGLALVYFCAYCSFDADFGWQSSISTIGGILLNAMLNTGFEYWKMRRHEAHEEERLDFNVDVKREGMRMEIQASEVLVGDILIVDKGDRVAADGVIYYSTDFWVDETAINPSEAFIPKVANWAPFVLAGTKVVSGYAEILVCAVGKRTLWMATMDTVVVNDGLTPHFAKQRAVVQLRRENIDPESRDTLSKVIKIAIVIMIAYPIIHSTALVASGKFGSFSRWLVLDPMAMCFYAATLVFIGACNGLPNVGTTVFTLLLHALAKPAIADRIEVWSQRHLEAMGSCDEMLVDKSGFCAQEELFAEVICLSGLGPIEPAYEVLESIPKSLQGLIEYCMLYRVEVAQHIYYDSKLDRAVLKWEGHPIDIALVRWFRKLCPGLDFEHLRGELLQNIVRDFEEESDELRRHSVLVRHENLFHFYCIGAAEFLLPLCDTGILPGGNLFDLDEKELMTINHNIDLISSQGLKPIMLAYREIKDPSIFLTGQENMLMEAPPEDHMCCICIFGLRQKIQPDAPEVIDFFRDSGVMVRMVSNDHVDPATYIAREVGLLPPRGLAVTSFELLQMDELSRFSAYASAQVFARFTPVDKYNLVRRLQDMDKVVLCTSYRASDTACMLQCDCAVALGNAVQGLHETSGVSIATLSPTALIDALLWSRYLWYCILKQTQFQLTAILSITLFSLVASVLGQTFPLHPFHLIDFNIMVDTLAPMCLGYERMRWSLERYLMSIRAKDVRNVTITDEMRREILGQAVYQVTIVSFVFLILPSASSAYSDPTTLAIASLCYNMLWWMNFINIVNCRCLIPRVSNPVSNLQNDFDFLTWMGVILGIHFVANTMGGSLVMMPPLSSTELAVCVILGIGGVFWRFLLRRTPTILFAGVRNWRLKILKTICRKQTYERYRIYHRRKFGVREEGEDAPLYDDEFNPRLVKDKELLRDYESEDEIDEDDRQEMQQEERERKAKERAEFIAEHGFAPEDDDDLPDTTDELRVTTDGDDGRQMPLRLM